ncbi:hypothetical protein CASFOL_035107 [Castilleja foliolosa]|uniref:FAF domain-containing protein n=1 Tax=Castilleja foliolosa TaxID=1961234 RepID=A0ABD3BRW6_9LAMI
MAVDHIKIVNPLSQNPWDQSPCTETFSDQLQHLKENNHNSSSSFSTMFSGDENGNSKNESFPKKQFMHSDSFSSVNSDNLSICTEGLGIESFDYVDDLLKDDCQVQEEREKPSFTRIRSVSETRWDESKRSRRCRGDFPPPISSIGKCGKPFVSFKSYRQDGRFILKEIRVPELLHACRENGRLRLRLIQSDDDDDDDDDDVDDDRAIEENVEEKNEDNGKIK